MVVFMSTTEVVNIGVVVLSGCFGCIKMMKFFEGEGLRLKV